MAENTKIEWADDTFNIWEGCEKVSPGCKFCYASERDKRWHDGKHWGPDSVRKPMSEAYWRKPRKWNREAEAAGERRRVFCSSLADVFEVLPEDHPSAQMQSEARLRLWWTIADTPHLDWLLLTKRPENFARILPGMPGDNLDLERVGPLNENGFPYAVPGEKLPNVWLGVTAENQEEADRRIPILLSTPAVKRFVSAEPLLSAVDLRRYLGDRQRASVPVDGGPGVVRGEAGRLHLEALSMDAGRHSDADSGRTKARGVQRVGRLPDDHVPGRRDSSEGVCPPGRLDDHESSRHPETDAGESHRWESKEPAPVKPGAGDPVGECEARNSSARETSSASHGGAAQLAGEAHGKTGDGNPRPLGGAGPIATGDGRAVRGEAEHDLRDRSPQELEAPRISWVIAGSERGPGARPADDSWFRDVRDQCEAAGVSFFFKQRIEGGKKISLPVLDGRRHAEVPA